MHIPQHDVCLDIWPIYEELPTLSKLAMLDVAFALSIIPDGQNVKGLKRPDKHDPIWSCWELPHRWLTYCNNESSKRPVVMHFSKKEHQLSANSTLSQ